MPTVTAPAWDTGFEVKEATIANLALARIGAELIKDTTEDTPSSRQVRSIFATTRDELLRQAKSLEFNFAQKNMTLSEDSAFASPKSGYSYAYTVPTTPVILKILEIGANPENQYQVIDAGASRRVLCNIISTVGTPNLLELRYVEQIIDPDKWDSLFKDAFVLRLASKLAIALTKRADLAQFLQGEFAAIFTLAKTAGASEAQTDSSDPLWTDRGQRVTQ